MAELSVEISARINKLEKELAKAKGEFKSLENSAAKTSSKIGKSSTLAAKGMKNLRGQTINGNSAMTAFSRTVQDAPFGIMGVSNNITNLTEQFGYLKNKTGSAGGALKAMLKDLKGFGGITLAISLVTSALLVFGDKIFKTKDKAKELRDEQEKLTKSLEDYVNGLESVSRANLKGERSAQKELVTLGLLKSQIENTTLSTNERKNAIDELRKKYPDYLQKMSDEKILNGGLASTYDTLTTSIIKRAKATASMNAIIKNSSTLLALNSKKDAKQFDLDNKKQAFIKKYGKTYKDVIKNIGGDSMGINVFTSELLVGITSINEELEGLEGKIQNLELSNIDLEANINTTDLFKGVVAGGGIKDVFVGFKEVYKKEKEDFQELIETDPIILADIAEGKSVDWESYFNHEAYYKNALLMKERLKQLNLEINALTENSLASAFTSIGQNIGQALANGTNVISAVGMGLLRSLGSFLSQLGSKLIMYGVLAKKKGALDVAMAIGGPAAIVAGAAAIKVGILAVAAGAAVSAFASGGGGGRASSNTDTFSPSGGGSFSGSGGGGMQNVVFEIQGTKLVGVLSNTLARNRNLGGSLSLT
tara:strand:- start:394 stop:2172 length:1779 start_codon:yes stop_codon:yes gene_type:complete